MNLMPRISVWVLLHNLVKLIDFQLLRAFLKSPAKHLQSEVCAMQFGPVISCIDHYHVKVLDLWVVCNGCS